MYKRINLGSNTDKVLRLLAVKFIEFVQLRLVVLQPVRVKCVGMCVCVCVCVCVCMFMCMCMCMCMCLLSFPPSQAHAHSRIFVKSVGVLGCVSGGSHTGASPRRI